MTPETIKAIDNIGAAAKIVCEAAAGLETRLQNSEEDHPELREALDHLLKAAVHLTLPGSPVRRIINAMMTWPELPW